MQERLEQMPRGQPRNRLVAPSETFGLLALLPIQHLVNGFAHKEQKARDHKQVDKYQKSHGSDNTPRDSNR